MKKVIYIQGSTNIYTEIITIDNIEVCRYSRQPVKDIIAKELNAMVMDLNDAMKEIEKVEAQKFLTAWREITYEEHNEKLNVLPLEKWQQARGVSIFRMCEYMTSNITAHYAIINIDGANRYFTTYRRTSWDYANCRGEILDSI